MPKVKWTLVLVGWEVTPNLDGRGDSSYPTTSFVELVSIAWSF
jgi:hypothetical protein